MKTERKSSIETLCRVDEREPATLKTLLELKSPRSASAARRIG